MYGSYVYRASDSTEDLARGPVIEFVIFTIEATWTCFRKRLGLLDLILHNLATKLNDYQQFFFEKNLKDSILYVDANGEMNYTLKGAHVGITVS